MDTYVVRESNDSELSSVDFTRASVGRVSNVRPESNKPVPEVFFRVLHDADSLYVCFDVKGEEVRSVHTAFQDPVYKDSCVEFFVQPVIGKGYFNFEINAGGAMLLTYIEDHHRVNGALAKVRPFAADEADCVQILSTLPAVLQPECASMSDWSLRYRIPLSLFLHDVGPVTFEKPWRANFYKCGDETPRPHWMSWSPVPILNFHLPETFGRLVFQAGGNT